MRHSLASFALVSLFGLLQTDGIGATSVLYWTDWGTDSIESIDLNAMTRSTPVPFAGNVNPAGVFVTENHLYWVGAGNSEFRSIQRADLDGSNVTDLLTDFGALNPRGIAVTGSYIYLAESSLERILRTNLDGSGLTTLVSSGLDGPFDISVTNSYIFWSDPQAGRIQRSNLDGSNVVEIVTSASGFSFPTGIAIAGDFLYWADDVSGSIQRSNLDGSGITTLLTIPSVTWNDIEVTDSHIYWTDNSLNPSIQRSNIDGSNVEIVTSAGVDAPIFLAIPTPNTSPIPEPSRVLLSLAALGAVVLRRRRRRTK